MNEESQWDSVTWPRRRRRWTQQPASHTALVNHSKGNRKQKPVNIRSGSRVSERAPG